MSEGLYDRLKKRSARSSNTQPGSPRTTTSRAAADHFSSRPGMSPSPQPSTTSSVRSTPDDRSTTLAHSRTQQTTQLHPQTQTKKREVSPWDETDRPPAYYPPAERDYEGPDDWKPPSFWKRLKELGWRMAEVAAGAGGEAAFAAMGRELGYFFSKRRFGIRDAYKSRRR